MGVLSVVSTRELYVPCMLVESRGKRFLIDNYFINKLEYPHRRALLIYKVEGIEDPAFSKGLVLKGEYELQSILRLLRESYEWIQSMRLNKAMEVYKDFRISLIAPVNLYRKLVREPEKKRVSEWELNGAQVILEGVFGREELLCRREIRVSLVREAYIKVMLQGRGKMMRLKSSNKQVERTYNWLYKSDSMFRRELNSML